jgi:small subunit ribosomal protein S21
VLIFAPAILKERRLRTMLIIPIKEGENIDRALKRFKRKFDKTGTKRSLQTRKQFTKPSVRRRAQIQKAQYIQRLRDAEDI